MTAPTRPRWRIWLKRSLLWGTLAALVIAAAWFVALWVPVASDPTERFEERAGALLEVRTTSREEFGDTILEERVLTSSSGLEVEIAFRIPLDREPPHPTVLVVGGQETGRDAVRLLPATRGIALAAVSYPYRPKMDLGGPGLLYEMPRMQRALLDSPPAIRLALDHLMSTATTDPGQVEVVGVSFGAFLVPSALAGEDRVRRVWLVHGAADPERVFEHGLRHDVPWDGVRGAAASFLAFVSGSRWLAPELWVGKISPTPLVVVNARDDEAFPPECIAMLHASLRDPHEILWVTGGHVQPNRPDTVRRIADLVFGKISEDLPLTRSRGR
jgi:hypothetical protein